MVCLTGVAGDAVQLEGVAGERIVSDALGVGGPENCPSDSASLLTGLIIPHAVMSSRMHFCRSGFRKKCIFNVASLRSFCFLGRLCFLST